jgi:hypothetical protein
MGLKNYYLTYFKNIENAIAHCDYCKREYRLAKGKLERIE